MQPSLVLKTLRVNFGSEPFNPSGAVDVLRAAGMVIASAESLGQYLATIEGQPIKAGADHLMVSRAARGAKHASWAVNPCAAPVTAARAAEVAPKRYAVALPAEMERVCARLAQVYRAPIGTVIAQVLSRELIHVEDYEVSETDRAHISAQVMETFGARAVWRRGHENKERIHNRVVSYRVRGHEHRISYLPGTVLWSCSTCGINGSPHRRMYESTIGGETMLALQDGQVLCGAGGK